MDKPKFRPDRPNQNKNRRPRDDRDFGGKKKFERFDRKDDDNPHANHRRLAGNSSDRSHSEEPRRNKFDRNERNGDRDNGKNSDRNNNRRFSGDKKFNDKPFDGQRRERERPELPPEEEFPDIPKGIAVRRAAVDILAMVRDGRSLDEALMLCRSYNCLGKISSKNDDMSDVSSPSDDTVKDSEFARADRGFARAIATMVLRRRGTLDYLITPLLERPLPAKLARVMDIIRCCSAQTLFMETPAHAAVSLATSLAKERQETNGYAGLVNALSRKLSKTKPERIESLPQRLDTPAWLYRSWERGFGPVLTKKIVAAHRIAAPLDIILKNPDDYQIISNAFKEAGTNILEFDHGARSQTIRLSPAPSDVTKLPGYDNGQWWIQDIAASLPVKLLGDLHGKTVIDLCAAPGGKTLQLANAGAIVTAIDKSEPRLERVSENLARTKLNADIIPSDALYYNPEQKVDIVLLDAPCSSTGTIRRHPDIPWTKTETDITGLAILQANMIDHALTLIKPGGILLYVVCSLQSDEGEKQIEKCLARHPDVSRNAFSAEDDPLLKGVFSNAINRHGDLRLTPAMAARHGGMDGFFIARLTKN